MDIPMHKYEAENALSASIYPPRQLVTIHAGAAAVLSLILTAISWFLSSQTGTGGIGGLGAQAALSTAQTAVQLVAALITPFWSAGLTYCALNLARKQTTEPASLLEGFRRWRPLLSSMLLMGFRYLTTGFIAAYLASALAMILQAMSEALFMAIFFGVFAVLATPLFFRWRLVHYIIMDEPEAGGLKAMFMSRAMMEGRKLELFRLDLSFWWFYALEFLTVAIGSAGAFMTDAMAFWGVTLLSLAGQFALYVWAKPKLAVTYALAYETLRQPPAPNAEPPHPEKPHPWSY